MNRAIELSKAATDDLAEAWMWYETQREGLGDGFLFATEESMRRISRRPESFIAVDGRVRRALVRRFPYSVYFLTEPERVVVIAVLHASRHPDEWRKRS